MGLSLVPATIAAMEGVTPHESGLASGLLNTSRLVGGALGLAVLSAIAAGQEHGVVPVAQGMTDGFGIAFEVGSALCLLGAATAALLLRATGAERTAAAPERPSRAEPSARSERAREETELLAA
jgi:hypothetical protein